MSKNINVYNCPIVVCTYNRPEYLEKCLTYIFKIPDICEYNVPVYIFCDGGQDATLQENMYILEKFPITQIFTQTENLCIARHIHYIRETIFDVMKYERMMFIEDDILVSPYYYRFMNRALTCYENIDPTVGMINSALLNHDSYEYKLCIKTYFVDSLAHLNNFIMKKYVWDVIKPIMNYYINTFVIPAVNYKNMDHDSIMKWARGNLDISNFNTAKHISNKRLTTSQDSITNMAMRTNNFRYTNSCVNRAMNIGQIGFHFDPSSYIMDGYDRVVLDIIPDDANDITSIYDMDLKKEFIIT